MLTGQGVPELCCQIAPVGRFRGMKRWDALIILIHERSTAN